LAGVAHRVDGVEGAVILIALDRWTLWLRGVLLDASFADLASAILARWAVDASIGDPVFGLMIAMGPRWTLAIVEERGVG